MKVLILHGLGGSDSPHWQAWLANELVQLGHTVCFPSLPDRDNPQLLSWKKVAFNAYEQIKPDIIICHSLANFLWIHLVNEYPELSEKFTFLVAPPALTTTLTPLIPFIPTIFPTLTKATLILSTNDPYCNEQEGKEWEEKLKIQGDWLTNAGHINIASGFGVWPLIKELILS